MSAYKLENFIMVNNLCKYCIPNICKDNLNLDGRCTDKFKDFLTDLHFYAKYMNYDINSFISTRKFNRDELSQLTIKYFGFTPKIMLDNIRLEIAIKSITENSYSEPTGNSCGFGKKRTFERILKRRFNMTFSQIRRLIVNSKNPEKKRKELIDYLWESGKKIRRKIVV
ncbi:MAG: AraC family transcriptional regulator [Bacteroidetes bacterium]|nr:MAG: AraC family transcriptional regulator [Bacteroidota bacterium]